MPIVTRSTILSPLSARPVAKDDDDDITCAICLSSIGEDRVKTFCGHYFHGQCLVDSLQYKRECPMCRQAPSLPGEDADQTTDDAIYESETINRVLEIVISRLDRFPVQFLRTMLDGFDISQTANWSDKDLVCTAAEQLLYETDSEPEEDVDVDHVDMN